MSKAGSVSEEWEFVSIGTEISVGKFVIEYFTPITLDRQRQDTASDEDTVEIWETAREEVIRKVTQKRGEVMGTELDEKEVGETFWLSFPDGWVINRKTKRIIPLEYKRTSDTSEKYYEDMKAVVEKQHTPILIGL